MYSFSRAYERRKGRRNDDKRKEKRQRTEAARTDRTICTRAWLPTEFIATIETETFLIIWMALSSLTTWKSR
jgi:hypothetical protein